MATSPLPLPSSMPSTPLPSPTKRSEGVGGLQSPVGGAGAGAGANPLAKKLAKVLETRLDNPEMLTALDALSTYYTENTLKARRNLRGDIDRRNGVLNRQFLDAMSLVNEEMTKLDQEISGLTMSCQTMQERLMEARQQTAQLLEQTSVLTRERQTVLERKKVASAFVTRFSLSPEEMQVITGSKQLKLEFFDVLEHVRSIHSECKTLLLSEHQKAGLEIMESVSLYQEAAFEKLYHWMQSEAKMFSRGAPDVAVLHQRAMTALRDRPVLHQSCVDEICTVRRSVLAQMFIDALTKGGPNGTPRPMELHAHDPMRYVSDMLAWLHQALASERELLESLGGGGNATGDKDGGRAGSFGASWAQPDMFMQQWLDKISEGAGRPLKVRVDQLLVSQPETLVAFQLSHLLRFYSLTIEKIVGSNSRLIRTLTELTQSAFKVFFDGLSAQTRRLLLSSAAAATVAPSSASASGGANSGDLAPPVVILETLDQLKQILASFDISLVPADQRETEITPVVDAVVSPLLQLATASAAALGKLDGEIFQVNVLHAVQNALILFPFTSRRAQTFEGDIDKHVDAAASEKSVALLKLVGLQPLLDAMQRNSSSSSPLPLSRVPGMDARSLSVQLEGFHSTLFTLSPESFVPKGIVSARLGRQISARAVQLFAAAYRSLAEAVFLPTNLYEFPATLIVRSPEEVVTLLGAEPAH